MKVEGRTGTIEDVCHKRKKLVELYTGIEDDSLGCC